MTDAEQIAALRASLLVQADKRAELEVALGEALSLALLVGCIIDGSRQQRVNARIVELTKLLAQQEPK